MDAQTAALITSGGLGVIGLGVQNLTNSKLEVKVDRFIPTDQDLDRMRLGQLPALARAIRERQRNSADPVVSRDLRSMLEVASRLEPIMNGMECILRATAMSINQLRQVASTGPEVAAQFRPVLNDFEGIQQASANAVKLWRMFREALASETGQGGEAKVSNAVALALFRLRTQLLDTKPYEVGREYIDLLVTLVHAAMIQDINADPESSDKEALRSKLSNLLEPLRMDKTAAGLPQLATALDVVRQALAIRSGPWPTVDKVLLAFGLQLTAQELVRLHSKAEILAVLSASASRRMRASSTGGCVDSALVPEALNRARADALDATYSYQRLSSDINFGPIRNEVMQVLMTGSKHFDILTNPDNEARWRLFSSAKSDGGAGNLDSIIYLENMGRPILKTSAFDPTKFIVAQGALYRQIFAATAGALGAPASSGGSNDTAGSATNVFTNKARLQTAKKAVAAQQAKLVGVLKYAIDEQSKVSQGAGDGAKEVGDALDKLAQQLEMAGTGQ